MKTSNGLKAKNATNVHLVRVNCRHWSRTSNVLPDSLSLPEPTPVPFFEVQNLFPCSFATCSSLHFLHLLFFSSFSLQTSSRSFYFSFFFSFFSATATLNLHHILFTIHAFQFVLLTSSFGFSNDPFFIFYFSVKFQRNLI